MEIRYASMSRTSSVEHDGLGIIGLLFIVVLDGLAMVGIPVSSVGWSCKTGITLIVGCWFAQVA